MIAVILAAGMGLRLRPMTETRPKGLVEIEGRTLLEYSLENLEMAGIREAVLVVGFLGELIREKFGNSYRGISIHYAENPLYGETGSMYSLSMARELLHNLRQTPVFEPDSNRSDTADDILLLESDLLYDRKALDRLLQSGRRDAILTADVLGNGDDVFICVNERLQVTNLGKKIPEEQKNGIAGCLVGISKFSPDFLGHLFETAEGNYRNSQKNRHYEECVLETALMHEPVYAVHCDGLAWTEIDNEADLNTAGNVIYPRIYGKGPEQS